MTDATTYALQRPIKLDDVARAVGTSVFHLCRVFEADSGTTLHRYRNELRLRRSLEMVAERGASDHLAWDVGYHTLQVESPEGTTPPSPGGVLHDVAQGKRELANPR